jgi:hypothetical protein
MRVRRVEQHAGSSVRPAESPGPPGQHHHRLSPTDITELIAAYSRAEPVHRIAKRFGIHRATVTALLKRHGVELRQTGLTPAEILEVTGLYGDGWSCARLGHRFGVDAATVWRALRAADVVLRSPSQRRY